MTEKERVKRTLFEWRRELEWNKNVLNDPTAEKKYKDNAKQRIKVAETWIAKILKDYPDLA